MWLVVKETFQFYSPKPLQKMIYSITNDDNCLAFWKIVNLFLPQVYNKMKSSRIRDLASQKGTLKLVKEII